ncbi:MAG: hypothetical protein ACFFD1_12640, partial [Candidatus Thorarchaeota archaeon]
NCLNYFFSSIMQRLTTGGLSLNYAQDLHKFNIWTPLIIYDNMSSQGYASAHLENWLVNQSLVQETLNTNFPLLNFTSSLLWFDSNNMTEFNPILDNYQVWSNADNEYLLDVSRPGFLDSTLAVIHNILQSFDLSQYDIIFPSFLLLQPNMTLTSASLKIGGIGQIPSNYSEIASWTLEGRTQNSYFYAGNASEPRDNLETTVIHELGHSLGLPHPHTWGYFLDSSTESTMGYYSRSNTFDQFDRDLVLHGLTLQVLTRYQDEIDYFRPFTTISQQNNTLDNLATNLSKVMQYIILDNYQAIRTIFLDTESILNELSNQLGEPRKSNNWSPVSQKLPVQFDFIIGGGFINGELSMNQLNNLNTQINLTLDEYTDLPKPTYQIKTNIYYVNTSYQGELKSYFESLLKQDITSNYDPTKVTQQDWNQFPRKSIFQIIEGESINGYQAENWLQNHPATPNLNEVIHYRYYIFNLENINIPNPNNQNSETSTNSETSSSETPSTTATTPANTSIELLIALATTAIVVKKIVKRRKIK